MVGGVYTFKLLTSDIQFINLNVEHENESLKDSQIKTVNLSITGSEYENVEYKNGIVEIPYNSVIINDDEIVIGKEIYDQVPIDVNTIIHLTSTEEENDCYIKVLSFNSSGSSIIAKFGDCEADEVFEDFSFNANDIKVENDRILEENKGETLLMMQ